MEVMDLEDPQEELILKTTTKESELDKLYNEVLEIIEELTPAKI